MKQFILLRYFKNFFFLNSVTIGLTCSNFKVAPPLSYSELVMKLKRKNIFLNNLAEPKSKAFQPNADSFVCEKTAHVYLNLNYKVFNFKTCLPSNTLHIITFAFLSAFISYQSINWLIWFSSSKIKG